MSTSTWKYNKGNHSCITRCITGTDGDYFADEDGDIYSTCRGRAIGCQLKPHLSKWGYLNVQLRLNGTTLNKKVHRLIAQTFLPNPLNLPDINHINGIKTDNRRVNLEWCTKVQNMRHSMEVLKTSFAHRTYRGHESNLAKLNESDVYELFEHLKNKGTVREFTQTKNISQQNVSLIVKGKIWSHLNIDWSQIKNN